MPKFKIPVVWQMWGVMIIKADSLKDAEDIARGTKPLPEGFYLDNSIVLGRNSMLYGEIVKEGEKNERKTT